MDFWVFSSIVLTQYYVIFLLPKALHKDFKSPIHPNSIHSLKFQKVDQALPLKYFSLEVEEEVKLGFQDQASNSPN